MPGHECDAVLKKYEAVCVRRFDEVLRRLARVQHAESKAKSTVVEPLQLGIPRQPRRSDGLVRHRLPQDVGDQHVEAWPSRRAVRMPLLRRNRILVFRIAALFQLEKINHCASAPASRRTDLAIAREAVRAARDAGGLTRVAPRELLLLRVDGVERRRDHVARVVHGGGVSLCRPNFNNSEWRVLIG
jgi:hypothetical protein